MDDNQAAADAALSTVIGEDASGERSLPAALPDAPQPEPKPEQAKTDAPRETTRISVEKSLDAIEAKEKADADAKGKQAAEDAKAKADEALKGKDGPQRTPDGKFKAGDETAARGVAEKPAAGQDGTDRRQSEGQYREPPARFLPEARAKWANTPDVVKAELHRVTREHEAEIAKGREVSERYEPIRKFDDIARSNGRNLHESLQKVVAVEEAIARNPVTALDMILQEIGPRKQDGSPLTFIEVAQMAVRNPQAFQQPHYAAPQQTQPNGEIQALRAELQAMRAEQTVMPVIAKFIEDHPDYPELEPRIEQVLKSGLIDQIYGTGLTLEQKLTEAYRMAGGGFAPSRSDLVADAANSGADDVASQGAARPDAGTKSIKGAPIGGLDPQKRLSKSNREAAAKALAEIGF